LIRAGVDGSEEEDMLFAWPPKHSRSYWEKRKSIEDWLIVEKSNFEGSVPAGADRNTPPV
jgi:hypothetical protein